MNFKLDKAQQSVRDRTRLPDLRVERGMMRMQNTMQAKLHTSTWFVFDCLRWNKILSRTILNLNKEENFIMGSLVEGVIF